MVDTIEIRHEGLGATAEVAAVSLPEWQAVGWTAVAPTDADRAAEAAPRSSTTKKQPPTEKEIP